MRTHTPIGENRRLFGAALVASVLAVLILVNVSITALATRFGWYLYTEEKYEHTIGEASHAVLDEVGSERVRVLFCMSREALEGDVIYSLVHATMLQLAERYDFIDIEYKNIYLNPSEVKPFRTRTLATGETVESPITERSVIFVSGEDASVFRVESLQSFFVLDDQEVITAYNGEEVALSCLAWILRDRHPVAAFTALHGENFGSLLSFSTALVAAGYDISVIDLDMEIPSGVELVVIANPRWDFDRGAEGSGIESELDRLGAYLDAGGSLFVSLDPYVKEELGNLRDFLSDRGLSVTQDVIRDRENSITPDGFTLVTHIADGETGAAVAARVGAHSNSRAVVREGSAIECGTKNGWAAEPLLLSSSAAETYRNGELVSDAGSFPVFAVARPTEGSSTSCILLSSSVYFLANDALNSASYTNRDILLSTLETASGMPAPVGCRVLAVSNEYLEDLTMGTARLYAWLLIAALPLAVAAVGVAVTIRRKTR